MIYFIGQDWDHPVKIGIAKNPKSRLGQLQTGNPSRLKILDTYEPKGVDDCDVEKRMHKAIKEYRLTGEWFDGPAAMAIRNRKGDFKTNRKIRFVQKGRIKNSWECENEDLKDENSGLRKTILELRKALLYFMKKSNSEFKPINSMKERIWWRSKWAS